MCWFIHLEILSHNAQSETWIQKEFQSDFELEGTHPYYTISKNGCLCDVFDSLTEFKKFKDFIVAVLNHERIKSLKLTKFWSEIKKVESMQSIHIDRFMEYEQNDLKENVQIKIVNPNKFYK